jgi:hypothetical protein
MLNKELEMIGANMTLNTSGDSLWSDAAKEVKVVGIALAYISDDKEFGELRVYFDTATWDVDTDGLIYTDSGFEAELKTRLALAGYNAEDVYYSEQGMQGRDFVSLDCEGTFIASYAAKHPAEVDELWDEING